MTKHENSSLNRVYRRISFDEYGQWMTDDSIWDVWEILFRDLADITVDGRLDKREFAIACHLIASQVNTCRRSALMKLIFSFKVQRRVPLPPTLPAALLSDALAISSNGGPPMSTSRKLRLWTFAFPQQRRKLFFLLKEHSTFPVVGSRASVP